MPDETERPKKDGRRAAAYLRTARQDSSLDEQTSAICSYARAHGFEIVRTFTDKGRSGLTGKGREAFQEMLALVESGRAEFEAILVYDISRWSRFQDADESAYYEYICKRAGVFVRLCAAAFEGVGEAKKEPLLSVGTEELPIGNELDEVQPTEPA